MFVLNILLDVFVVIKLDYMSVLWFCRLSCDMRVLVHLRSRTLGNSANRLYNTLREQHSEAWMRRAIQYIGVCEQFLALRGQTPPPQMPPLPSPVWLLTVYSYDVLSRLDEYKARITSTFESILKMDSTKKASEVFHNVIFSYSCFNTTDAFVFSHYHFSSLSPGDEEARWCRL